MQLRELLMPNSQLDRIEPVELERDVDLIERVHAAIDRLPRQERQVITALWTETGDVTADRPGRTVSEVARELGIGRNTVRRIEKRALERLKGYLTDGQ